MNTSNPKREVERVKRSPIGEIRVPFDRQNQAELHIYQDTNEGQWYVWINTGVADNDGVCLAVADTRDAAVGLAMKMLDYFGESCHTYMIHGSKGLVADK